MPFCPPEGHWEISHNTALNLKADSRLLNFHIPLCYTPGWGFWSTVSTGLVCPKSVWDPPEVMRTGWYVVSLEDLLILDFGLNKAIWIIKHLIIGSSQIQIIQTCRFEFHTSRCSCTLHGQSSLSIVSPNRSFCRLLASCRMLQSRELFDYF